MRDHGPTLSGEAWSRVGTRLTRVETWMEQSEYGKLRDRHWWRWFWFWAFVILLCYAVIVAISLQYSFEQNNSRRQGSREGQQ